MAEKYPLDVLADMALIGIDEQEPDRDSGRPFLVARALDALAPHLSPTKAKEVRARAKELRASRRRFLKVQAEHRREEAFRNAHPRSVEELLADAEKWGHAPSMVESEDAIWRSIPEEQRKAAMFEGKVRREMGLIRAHRRSWSQWSSVAQSVASTSPRPEPKGPNRGFVSCLQRIREEDAAARTEAMRRLKEETP